MEQFELDHLSATWFRPRKSREGKVLLYLHGGGYAVGSVKGYRSLIAKISKTCRVDTLAIDYRLAPEHPFPAALNDAELAYSFLLEIGYSAKNIILVGDSAGGGLVISTLLKLKNRGRELPSAAMLISPWLDLEAESDSYFSKRAVDPILPYDKIKDWAKQYAGNESLRNPLISPINGNLSDLPPVFIQVGTEEMVLDDAVRFARTAVDYGVKAELKVWNAMPHVWHICWPILPEAKKAIREMNQFVDKIWFGKTIKTVKSDSQLPKLALAVGKVSLGAIIWSAGLLKDIIDK